MLHIRNPRHPIHKLRQIRRPARRLQFPAAMQILSQRHEVNRMLRFSQRNHALENPPVRIEKEVISLKFLDRRIQRVIVEQNRAKNASAPHPDCAAAAVRD